MSSVNIRNKILRENYLASLGVVTELSAAVKRGEFQRNGSNSIKYVGNNGREKTMSSGEVEKHWENVKNFGAICFVDYKKAFTDLEKILAKV